MTIDTAQSGFPGLFELRWRLLLSGIAVNLILFSLNHLVGAAVNAGDYTPFAVDPHVSEQVYDEAQLYAPGPSRFFHSGQVSGELDVRELGDVPVPLPVMHSVVLGVLAKTTGSLEWAWMAGRTIFPTLIWGLLFLCSYPVLQSGALAMAVSWLTCLFAFGPRNMLLLGQDSFLQPLELGRLPQPGLSFLVLLLACLLLARALLRPGPFRITLAGIAAGALFYSYYFYWIAFFAGAGALWIVFLMLRRPWAKTLFAVLAIGCAAGIPFFLWTLQAMRSGHQQDLMIRVGEFSRRPDIKGLALAALFLALLWIYCRFRMAANADQSRLLIASLLAVAAGAALGLNFHLLTGYNAQHEHFYNRVLQPFVTYLLALWILGSVPLRKRLNTRAGFALTCAAILVLLSAAALRQIEVGRNTAIFHRRSNPDIDVLTWLRSHEPTGVVVGSTDRDLLTLIPGIAGTWTFVPLGDRSMASSNEILTRFLMLSRLEGKTWPEVESELKADQHLKSNASALSYALIMERRIAPRELHTAHAIWDRLDLRRDLENRRLDFFIAPVAGANDPMPLGQGEFRPVYRNSRWRVFDVRPVPGSNAGLRRE